jgi:tRNA (Thr-GGU) A37 N-methylase
VLPASADRREPEVADTIDALDALIDVIDRFEQDCARLAENNKVLVLALMDQSQALVDYLYKQVVPKEKGAYSPHGKYASRRPEAALIKGKF